ncbi:TMEM175 family protein [Hyphomonas sp. NPDC076900]|uniref:TMEM175 family protein n=1 Tax=unclassified Hyphomonas TaxID=2630699 RepID=UPI003CFC350C
MIRELVGRDLDHDPRFRWRGGPVTRIENLSDIVFALAFGMLVSTATRPTTFSEVSAHLLTIIPVAAGFALLVLIWNAHFTFFRRYGVADGRIIFLNCVLLLLVLFVAYPLRFVFDSLFGFLLSLSGDWSALQAAGIGFHEAGRLMSYFAFGYGLIFVIISLMYFHALSRAPQLGLSELEKVITRQSIWHYGCQAGVAVLTGAVAWLTPAGPAAGFLFMLIGPLVFLVQSRIKVPADGAGEPNTPSAPPAEG